MLKWTNDLCKRKAHTPNFIVNGTLIFSYLFIIVFLCVYLLFLLCFSYSTLFTILYGTLYSGCVVFYYPYVSARGFLVDDAS